MIRLLQAITVMGVLALSSVAFAHSVSYSGNTETSVDGTWFHPNVMFTSVDADTTLYSVQAFTVGLDGLYDISSIQGQSSTGATFDGMVFVYAGAFDPNNPMANGIAGDDDGSGGPGTSAIAGLGLSTGTTYYLVTSGFATDETVFGVGSGPFTNTIEGVGEITLQSAVPIPAAIWLMLSGLAGLRLFRRK